MVLQLFSEIWNFFKQKSNEWTYLFWAMTNTARIYNCKNVSVGVEKWHYNFLMRLHLFLYLKFILWFISSHNFWNNNKDWSIAFDKSFKQLLTHTENIRQFFCSWNHHWYIAFQKPTRKDLYFSLNKTFSWTLSTTNEGLESKYAFWYYFDIVCVWRKNLQHFSGLICTYFKSHRKIPAIWRQNFTWTTSEL